MRELLRWFVFAISLFSDFGHVQSIDNGAKASEPTGGSKTASTTLSSKSTVSAIIPTFGNGSCPSRTANYITHTLPQQCLRTDRVSSTSNIAATADASAESPGSRLAPILATPSSEGNANATDEGPEPPSTLAAATESSGATAATMPSPATSPTIQASEEDSDSPLDNANFLSFEEWKKQNLAKVDSGQGRQVPFDGGRQRPGINNALDSLGDEGEIDLDFPGFGGPPSGPSQPRAAYKQPDDAQDVPTSRIIRSKDAGITCKERTNYASFDCAAQVLKHNPECKSPYSVLVENKDSYMLNTCSAQNKFFIVELCNDILIDTVVLANYEFFSSIFRHFRVSVSDRYPVKMEKWRELGTFEARNTRDIQAFLIEHPQMFARYLRVEILSHYGSEYYCPVSLLRIHGTTMLEDVRIHDDTGQAEGEEDQVATELESEAARVISQDSAILTHDPDKPTTSLTESLQPLSSDVNITSNDTSQIATSETAAASGTTSHVVESRNASISIPTLPGPDLSEMTCSPDVDSSTLLSSSLTKDSSFGAGDVQSVSERLTSTQDTSFSKSSHVPSAMNDSALTNGSFITVSSNVTETISVHDSFSNRTATESKAVDQPISSPQPVNATSASLDTDTAQATTSTNTTRTVSATSSISQPQPSIQESFFKSLSKRLHQLESNSTLSLQYIEEQSRILRDAFSKVEKRQLSSTSNFLNNLNETVIKELHGFRQAYDQLWQSTVLELEAQREQYQREMLVLSSRLTLVADELVWQKRMGIVQSGLLLLCLGLVLFARQGLQGYLEVPLMQQMMNKSSAALSRAGWESPPASPSPENRSPVALFRRKLWRSATEPERVASSRADDGDVTGTDSRPDTRDGPSVDVFVEPPTPPTPPSSRGMDSGPVAVYDDADADDEEDVLDPRESQSGPSTPTGTRNIDRGSNITDIAIEGGVG